MPEGLISRRSLHAELVPLLRDLIIEGSLKPGEKVPEQTLCERFGVSRTPLREALKVLAAEGLLQLTPNRGARISAISPETVDEIFPVMGMLEALAGELACSRLEEAHLKELRKLHERMVSHYRRGAHAQYAKVNRAIHDSLFEIAGNATLTSLYHLLMVKTHSARYTAKKSAAHWAQAVEDHEELMRALERRDCAAVGTVLRRHLAHKAEQVHEALRLADLIAAPA